MAGMGIYYTATKNLVIHATISVEKKEYCLGNNITFYLEANTYSYNFNIGGDYLLGDVGIGIFRLPSGIDINNVSQIINESFILKLRLHDHGIVPFHWTNDMGKLKLTWNGTVLNRTENKFYSAQEGYYLIYPSSYFQKDGHLVEFTYSKSAIFHLSSLSLKINKSNNFYTFKISSPWSFKGELSEKYIFKNGSIACVNRSVNISSNKIYEIPSTISDVSSVERVIAVIKTPHGIFQSSYG